MALGALLPWNWGYSPHEKDSRDSTAKKRRVRTRAEQVAEHKKNGAGEKGGDDAAHFPGLVNMSGTHCFMNSTLQALASLSNLPPYLLGIRTRAEALDVPTPVVDALIDLLAALNTPTPTGQPLRALALVEALCTPPPTLSSSDSSAKANALLASHEHQDAQELFQLLSEAVREESARVAREAGTRGPGRGLAFALALLPPAENQLGGGGGEGADAGAGTGVGEKQSPFDGLTATRRACVRCGYTAAIRHFAFDSVQLALEGWGGTTLPALLRTYTALEVLQDCPCRRCALRATARRLQEEVARLEEDVDEDHGDEEDGEDEKYGHGGEKEKSSKKKPRKAKNDARLRRLKAARKLEARVRRALEAGRIEEEELEGEWDLDGEDGGEGGTGGRRKEKEKEKGKLKIEQVAGGVCTRQSMLGRPPAVLALHLNRSMHTGFGASKNSSRVAFPELLDLTPYTTSGVLSLDPAGALSGSLDTPLAFPSANAGATSAKADECLYRLSAVVCHYGMHAFGHYICYRRAPVAPSASASPSAETEAPYAPAPPSAAESSGTGTGWLRISDADVSRCGVEQVLSEGGAAFMLYYERVLPSPARVPDGAGVLAGAEAGDSAETIRPAHAGASGIGSGSGSGVGIASGFGGGEAVARARVVRSVSLGVGSRASVSSSSLSVSSSSLRSSGGAAVVEPLALASVGEVTGDGDGALVNTTEDARPPTTAPLPTPPPTPTPTPTEAPAASPNVKARKKKNSKKKGSQDFLRAISVS
ncbi:cysteine proteinase [Mycena olivaceomarginata]|nr:cysteine proteinase [Mycena olivaceomarginata]